jgi:oligopeptide transport system substrate-binding protein
MTGRSLLALAAILLGLSLTACGPQRVERAACPAGQRCLEYGIASEPTALDPQLTQSIYEAAIDRELFNGLYTDDAAGNPTLGAADKVTTSPDGLVWTFHLKPATWSDGVPVTASDFVYAYRRILDPKTASPYTYLVYLLKNGEAITDGKAQPNTLGAVALDPQTLQLTLEHPAPVLPQILKHQSYFPVPEHAIERWGDKWTEPAHFASNGPYVVQSWKLGEQVRLAKNPRYPDAAGLCFDRVDFVPTPDPVTGERRVLRGELDVNAGIQSNRVSRLRADPTAAPFVRSHPYLTTTYVIFNTRDVVPLQDRRVRTAIGMAIDRQFIADKLGRAGQVPTTSFVPRGIAGYLPPDGPHPQPVWAGWSLDRRKAAARELMRRAGYGPDRPLKLEIKMFNSASTVPFAEAIQADLQDIDVDTTFRLEDGAVIFTSFNIRDFQLGLVGWVADYDDPMTFLGLMKSDTGAQNYGDYDNPAYDALLNKADNEPDGAKRAQYLAAAEQMMLNDANVAPVLVGVNLNLVNPRISGWVNNDSDIHPIRDLCLNAAPPAVEKPQG